MKVTLAFALVLVLILVLELVSPPVLVLVLVPAFELVLALALAFVLALVLLVLILVVVLALSTDACHVAGALDHTCGEATRACGVRFFRWESTMAMLAMTRDVLRRALAWRDSRDASGTMLVL